MSRYSRPNSRVLTCSLDDIHSCSDIHSSSDFQSGSDVYAQTLVFWYSDWMTFTGLLTFTRLLTFSLMTYTRALTFTCPLTFTRVLTVTLDQMCMSQHEWMSLNFRTPELTFTRVLVFSLHDISLVFWLSFYIKCVFQNPSECDWISVIDVYVRTRVNVTEYHTTHGGDQT